jgi:urocanate hydratase
MSIEIDTEFKKQIQQGIPTELPPAKELDSEVSHAPKRKEILSPED